MSVLRRTLSSVALAAASVVMLTGVPASAADANPTIVAPATTAGYSTIVITGSATPGATVELYESAYVFHDLKPALDWASGSFDPVTTTATASGTYRISRWVDTGFLMAVRVNGVMSNTVTVHDRLVPILSLSSTRAGRVTARVVATPAQPWIPVQIQRKNANGTWTVVARGYTTAPGAFAVTLTRQASRKTYTYRAWLGGDTQSALLAAYSSPRSVKVR